jgi:molybdopterin-guanine dinucleotide biosynthesis protein A
MRDVAALILAGGKATRFGGIAKHELVIDGETILARQVRVLAPRVAEILVSGATITGYRSVHDAHEGVGPLAGIAAGLAAIDSAAIAAPVADANDTPRSNGDAITGSRDAAPRWLLVVAGDMPYLTGELIDAMLALRGDGVDAVGVRVCGLPEPLLCLLHVCVRDVVEARVAAHRFKASGLLTDEPLRVRWLDDPDPHALVNINSPSDLLS